MFTHVPICNAICPPAQPLPVSPYLIPSSLFPLCRFSRSPLICFPPNSLFRISNEDRRATRVYSMHGDGGAASQTRAHAARGCTRTHTQVLAQWMPSPFSPASNPLSFPITDLSGSCRFSRRGCRRVMATGSKPSMGESTCSGATPAKAIDDIFC